MFDGWSPSECVNEYEYKSYPNHDNYRALEVVMPDYAGRFHGRLPQACAKIAA